MDDTEASYRSQNNFSVAMAGMWNYFYSYIKGR